MKRFLGMDFLSGLMFIAFGVMALYFGQRLALGTPVRMGPGYVPRMLSLILLCLGSAIVLMALWRTAQKPEKDRYWLPIAGLSALLIVVCAIPWGAQFIAGLLPGWAKTAFVAMPIPIGISAVLIFDVVAICLMIALFGRPAEADDMTEKPAWKPITMVTIGVVCFALLFERAGLVPALMALVLIASLGGEEFKLKEVIGNMVVLSALCIVVFKIGLGMNIYVLRLAGW